MFEMCLLRPAELHSLVFSDENSRERESVLFVGTQFSNLYLLLFIAAVPSIKLFAWGEGIVEDVCYERRRAEACVGQSAHHALVNCCPPRRVINESLRDAG